MYNIEYATNATILACFFFVLYFSWLVGGFYYYMFLFRSSFTMKVPLLTKTDIAFTVLFSLFSVSCSLVSDLFSIKLGRKIHSKGQCMSFTKRHWSDLFRCIYSSFFSLLLQICDGFSASSVSGLIEMWICTVLSLCTWCVLSLFCHCTWSHMNGHK